MADKTIGGVVKPKFSPRAQPVIKCVVESVAEVTAPIPFESNTTSSGSSSSNNNSNNINNNSYNNSNSNSNNNRANRTGGRAPTAGGRGSGGGRAKWVAPVGVSFFTGSSAMVVAPKLSAAQNRAAKLAAKETAAAQKLVGAEVSIETVEEMDENLSAWADLGVERVVAAPTLEKLKEATSKRRGKKEDPVNVGNDDDSDGLDDEYDADPDEGLEQWPPEKAFSEQGPVTLPLGPHTLTMRQALASAPLLSTSSDPEVLSVEESTNLFIVQLPSDLLLHSSRDNNGSVPAQSESGAAANAGGESGGLADRSSALKPGHLGKLQVLQSGKVILIRNDGARFEVNGGLSPSFAQYLGSITIDKAAAAQATAIIQGSLLSPLPKTGKQQTKKSKSQIDRERSHDAIDSLPVPTAGELHLMGRLTRKWVVTPDFDIGKRSTDGPDRDSKRRAGSLEVVEALLDDDHMDTDPGVSTDFGYDD